MYVCIIIRTSRYINYVCEQCLSASVSIIFGCSLYSHCKNYSHVHVYVYVYIVVVYFVDYIATCTCMYSTAVVCVDCYTCTCIQWCSSSVCVCLQRL